MSDSKGSIGNADRDRIRGLMARSANVIAAAREGLDKSSTDLEDLSGASGPGSSKLKTGRPRLGASKVSVSERTASKTHIYKTPGPKFPAYKTPGAKSSEKPKLPDTESLNFKTPAPETFLMKPARYRSALASYATIEPVDNGKTASSHRRALLRRPLQTRDIEDERPLERFQRDGVGHAFAEEVDTGNNGKDRDEKGWLLRLRNRRAARAEETRALTPTAYLDTEAFNALILEDDADRAGLNREDLGRNDLDRDDLDQPAPWKDARFTHEPWEWRGAEPEPERHSGLSVMLSWTQRLDALTNAVAGVLIVTLLSIWTIGAGVSTPTNEQAVAQAETNAMQVLASPESAAKRAEADATGMSLPSEDPMAALIAITGLPGAEPEKTEAPLPSAHTLPASKGLHVLSTAFPKPLPPTPDDISTLHLWARASLPSAPGLAVLPYTGLPQTIPAMPPDIESQFLITTPQR
jgi:hypothetical protein